VDGSDVGKAEGLIDKDGFTDIDGANDGFIDIDGDGDGTADGLVDGDVDSQVVPMIYVSDDPKFPLPVFKSMLLIKRE